ncbi:MAG: caspase family protein, partial [Spirochaetes bacterium]|nr:caspase family protein [Spirochaetota bacterium]
TLASGSWDKTVKLWDVSSGKLIRTLEGHSTYVVTVSFSPDGKTLASGSYDKTVKLWDVSSGKLIRTLEGHTSIVSSVSFSSDGKTLASGSGDQTVKLWEVSSGKLIRPLEGHSSDVYSVSFSSDGKTLASGSGDCSIKYWRVSDGSLLASSHAFDKSDFITVSPSGYYVSSPTGEKYASWRIGNKIYGFEQYAAQFSRPEYIKQIMALEGDRIAAPETKIGIDLPPEFEWLNKDKLISCEDPIIVLICQYRGQKPWNDIFCLNNGQPIQIPKYPEEKDTATFKIPIPINTPGNNIIITASDKKKLKSNSITASISCVEGKVSISPLLLGGRKGPSAIQPSQPPTKKELGTYSRKYAIIIGIHDYKNLTATGTTDCNLKDLKYCHKDAESFKSILDDDRISGGNWEITCLVDEQATSGAVDDALSGVLTIAKPQDLVFIFFSGHGRSHPSKPEDVYLLTYDFLPSDNRSGFAYSTLRDLIRDSRAEHIITFLDACRTGIVGFKGNESGGFNQDVFGKRIQQMPQNKVIFTSGRGSQSAWEDDKLQQGVFTYFLLKGLRGDAPEQKNPEFVDLGELENYVVKNVEKFTKNSKDKVIQVPRIFEADGILLDDFPLAIRKR